ncbi:unnamed protein product [Calypogeia fissa]
MALDLSRKEQKVEQKVTKATELAADFSEDEDKVKVEMAHDESSPQEQKVVGTAGEELSGDEFRTSNSSLKRAHRETALMSNLSASPSKRQKLHEGVTIGEKEDPQTSVAKGEEVFNAHGDEKMHDIIGVQEPQNSVTKGEDASGDEEAAGEDVGGGVARGVATQSGPNSKVEEMTAANPGEGNNVSVKTGRPLPAADAKEIDDESRRKRMSDDAQLLQQLGSDDAASEDAEEEDSDPLYPRSTSDDSPSRKDDDGGTDDSTEIGNSRALVTASVNRRQQNDPELRNKLHELEIDFYADRIDRDQYNDERWELYSEEEAKAGRVLWPRPDVHSPAGFMVRQNENWSIWDDGDELDDALWRNAAPFEEDRAEEEEAAKKRLFDEIESKFKDDPEAKAAEYKRWEMIREVQTDYLHERISRNKYNNRGIALFTEEELKEMENFYEIRVTWPNGPAQECYSPAGYREDVFEKEGDPDLQTRLQFHYPFHLFDTDEEEKLCELCIPLIEEQKRQEEEKERRRREEELKKREKQERKRAAKTIACPACSKKFSFEQARRTHWKHKHPDLLEKEKMQQRNGAVAETENKPIVYVFCLPQREPACLAVNSKLPCI